MDLQFLRPLYEHFGGYVSVYLDTSRDSEDATGAVNLRWRSARERLASAGADHSTLDALAGVITDARRGAPGRAAFGRGGQVVLTEALPHPPRREIARLAPLPHVMPLLAQRRPHVPHLRVMARHDGGEIASVTAAGPQDDEEVTGTGRPVHKIKGGGSSQLRYARHTEDAWETNAKELAGRVTAEARAVGAELIVVAGDPVARTLLVRELGADLAAITVTIEREVSADSDEAARAADEAVAQHVAQRSQERFGHWRTQLAHDHGVQGLAATMTALRDGGVAELLLADHPESAADRVDRARGNRAGRHRGRADRAGRPGPGAGPRRRRAGPRSDDQRCPAVLPARGPGHWLRSPAGRRRRGAAPAPGSRHLTSARAPGRVKLRASWAPAGEALDATGRGGHRR